LLINSRCCAQGRGLLTAYLLDSGDGGFVGGLNAEKYIHLTGASKATATRDLAELVAQGRLWTKGAGKALRYFVNVPGWTHGVDRASAATTPPTLGGGLLAPAQKSAVETERVAEPQSRPNVM
jgi:hypothetical protein